MNIDQHSENLSNFTEILAEKLTHYVEENVYVFTFFHILK